MLLLQLDEKGAALNTKFELITHGWPTLNILECPIQEIKPKVMHTVTAARTKANDGKRKIKQGLWEIDTRATNASRKHLAKDEQGLLRVVQQGASWDKGIPHSSATTKTMCANIVG